MRKLLIVAAWYFILYSPQTILQVGPFASEASCSNFAKSLNAQLGTGSSTCFSTTSKQ
ncbi:hypothetical protein [Candidatus Binatus sp.]|uniref:hypothetical protein n=1 Tax=Candidatus Binatus sp. TaxID=2811406 RepID=UPI003CC62765